MDDSSIALDPSVALPTGDGLAPVADPAEATTPSLAEGDAPDDQADSQPAKEEPVSLRLANKKLAEAKKLEAAAKEKEASFAKLDTERADLERQRATYAQDIAIAKDVREHVAARDVIGLLEKAGFSAKDVLDAISDPDIHKKREQKTKESEVEAQVRKQQQTEAFLDELTDARGDHPATFAFIREHGERAFMREAWALADKWNATGRRYTNADLRAALETAAKRISSKPTSPASDAASPAAQTRKPGALTQRVAATPGGKTPDEMSDDERREVSIRMVEEAMRKDRSAG